MAKKIYFCTECKKRLKDVEEILFIEDNSTRGFCSEKCILSFYRLYMKVFQEEELKLRSVYSLGVDEKLLTPSEEEHFIHEALYSPHEIWQDTSELSEVYYTHILELELNGPVFVILICSYFESTPSFIYHKLITRSEKLVENYRVGDSLDFATNQDQDRHQDSEQETSYETDSEIELPAELIEQMELKKSQLLAELLEARTLADIDFEEFIDYEKFLTSTLETPDEVFEKTDDEGEVIATFIKSFKEDHFCFYYVAICWKCHVDGINDLVLVPILSFPSTDNDLYQDYAVGDKTLGQVKN